MRVAVLCASYNRAEKTLASLTLLLQYLAAIPDIEPKVFLLDDASPDGTGSQVRLALPNVTVIDGTGNLFWNRGMRAAFKAAVAVGPWDAYLIFNDDTDLLPDGLTALVETFRAHNVVAPTACVGWLTDLAGQMRTYGGYRHTGAASPLALKPLDQTGTDLPCDTFNGNCALIPAEPMEAVDPFPQVYHHQYGDLDLGYRLAARGVAIVECAAPVGRADRNPPIDYSTLAKRWKAMARTPNGLNQYAAFIRRTVPFPRWPVIMGLGLANRLVRILLG